MDDLKDAAELLGGPTLHNDLNDGPSAPIGCLATAIGFHGLLWDVYIGFMQIWVHLSPLSAPLASLSWAGTNIMLDQMLRTHLYQLSTLLFDPKGLRITSGGA